MRSRPVGLVRGYLVLLLLLGSILAGQPIYALVSVALAFGQVTLFSRSLSPSSVLGTTLITLLLTPAILVSGGGPTLFIALLLSAPGLVLLDNALRDLGPGTTPPRETRPGRRSNRTLNLVVATLLGIGYAGFLAGEFALLGAAALLLTAVLGRLLYVLVRSRNPQIHIEAVTARVLVQEEINASVTLENRSPFRLRIAVSNPDSWLDLAPRVAILDPDASRVVRVTGRPPLAGPVHPVVRVSTLDPWGLVWNTMDLNPLELHVIPRARYAAWLARRYLQQQARSRQDVSSTGASGGSRGVEFQSLRTYQPGDRLREIDWRHTLKLGKLTVKQYLDPQVGATAFLVNLVAADDGEADWLAYHLIMSALTAAREGVSVVFLAYDDRAITLTTGPVSPRETVKRALQLAGQVSINEHFPRLLEPPDVPALRREARLLETSYLRPGTPATGRALLFQIELAAVEELTRKHPLSDVWATLRRHIPPPATLTVLSQWNHDAEALAVTLADARLRRYRVIRVDALRPGEGSGGKTVRHFRQSRLAW